MILQLKLVPSMCFEIMHEMKKKSESSWGRLKGRNHAAGVYVKPI